MMRVAWISVGITVGTRCENGHPGDRSCQATIITDIAKHPDRTAAQLAAHVMAEVQTQLDDLLTHTHACEVEAAAN